jgi:hypothetical protein
LAATHYRGAGNERPRLMPFRQMRRQSESECAREGAWEMLDTVVQQPGCRPDQRVEETDALMAEELPAPPGGE